MKTFKAYRTFEKPDGFESEVTTMDFDSLKDHDVIIKVIYSGINYKDLLSDRGNRGVTRNYPHTPGIDAAGIINMDRSGTFSVGEEVVVMGYDLGMNTDGAFAEYISVPVEWVMRKPKGFSLKQTMQIGTSGFTAALGISKMLQMGMKPENGPVVVTGATGGVGMHGVQMLSKLGFTVWAVTGKKELEPALKQLGASCILGRDEVLAPQEKPLLRPRWAGALDTVGGEMLVSLLKQCSKSGSVATCGTVGGASLSMTVLPFILNGINLLGINAADTPMTERVKIWELLESIAEPDITAKNGEEIGLDEIGDALQKMSSNQHAGRYLIRI
ncbi:MAG: YhdH/YhfP family quinone oxidoreductase [Bacteroidales bacterium]